MKKKKTKKWIVCILVLVLIISIIPATVVVKGILLGKREWKFKSNKEKILILVDESNLKEQNAIKEIEYQNVTYTRNGAKIADNQIGDKLVLVTLTGNETLDANVFKIANCSEKCAVAVQFSNEPDYYVYENFAYNPETLGDLINDLNLKESSSFKEIDYAYDWIDLKLKKHTSYVEFYDVNNEEIWPMLFDNINLKNVIDKKNFDNYGYSSQIMNINVNIPMLGVVNRRLFCLRENGYLVTYSLGRANAAFYIGKDKVKQFINYIIENYDGYESRGWL